MKTKTKAEAAPASGQRAMKWHTSGKAVAPHFQAVVYDLDTGHNVAVTYDDQGADKARLIAAAPELLEALQHTLARLAAETKDVETCDLYPSTVAAMEEARAALAKAEKGDA